MLSEEDAGMMFLGGWLSFNGEMGKGGWGSNSMKSFRVSACPRKI